MHLQYPIQSAEVKMINAELHIQRLLFKEAFLKNEKFSVKKEIRLKIKDLEKQLLEVKEICLGLDQRRQ